jgi:hypothetical protein
MTAHVAPEPELLRGVLLRCAVSLRCGTCLVWVCSLAAGCGPTPEPVAGALKPRSSCGWDRIEPSQPPLTLAPGVTVAPGTMVATMAPDDDTEFGALWAAIANATSLVRIKLAIGNGELLALTMPARIAADRPKPEPVDESMVGYQKITRPKAGPRDRIADLRVEGRAVTVFVENDKPGGEAMTPADVANHLRAIQPPVGVFTLGASDDTRWRDLREVLVAAACYDREPGQEPHEIVIAPR